MTSKSGPSAGAVGVAEDSVWQLAYIEHLRRTRSPSLAAALADRDVRLLDETPPLVSPPPLAPPPPERVLAHVPNVATPKPAPAPAPAPVPAPARESGPAPAPGATIAPLAPDSVSVTPPPAPRPAPRPARREGKAAQSGPLLPLHCPRGHRLVTYTEYTSDAPARAPIPETEHPILLSYATAVPGRPGYYTFEGYADIVVDLSQWLEHVPYERLLVTPCTNLKQTIIGEAGETEMQGLLGLPFGAKRAARCLRAQFVTRDLLSDTVRLWIGAGPQRNERGEWVRHVLEEKVTPGAGGPYNGTGDKPFGIEVSDHFGFIAPGGCVRIRSNTISWSTRAGEWPGHYTHNAPLSATIIRAVIKRYGSVTLCMRQSQIDAAT